VEKSESVISTVGERLKQFAGLHGGVTALAAMLGISQPRLSNYIRGEHDIPNDLMIKLGEIGCDVNWLMTGITQKEVSRRFAELVEKARERPATREEYGILAILRSLGIRTAVDFHLYFDYARAVQDKVKRDRGMARKAAEEPAEYNTQKKGRKK
jgi:plasmid maintenance system antidote protein VapI